MIGVVRVLFVIIPLTFFVWYMVYHDNFVQTMEKINSMQGRDGALVINAPGRPTWGQRFAGFLDRHFGDKVSSDWRIFFSRSGRDIDTVIVSIESYWVWMIVAIFIISGGTMLYVFRKY